MTVEPNPSNPKILEIAFGDGVYPVTEITHPEPPSWMYDRMQASQEWKRLQGLQESWDRTDIYYLYPAKIQPQIGQYGGDVGIDIHADLEAPMTLIPGDGAFIWGGFQLQFPRGYFGMVVGRSSLNRKGLMVMTGVIDTGYTGLVGAEVRNISCDTMYINPMDRIAQLLVLPAVYPLLLGVDTFEPTDRGHAGWGSSGR